MDAAASAKGCSGCMVNSVLPLTRRMSLTFMEVPPHSRFKSGRQGNQYSPTPLTHQAFVQSATHLTRRTGHALIATDHSASEKRADPDVGQFLVASSSQHVRQGQVLQMQRAPESLGHGLAL